MALAIGSLLAMMVLGVIEILAGTDPRALRVRLQSMLPPGDVRHSAA
jgi:hypothetical protein